MRKRHVLGVVLACLVITNPIHAQGFKDGKKNSDDGLGGLIGIAAGAFAILVGYALGTGIANDRKKRRPTSQTLAEIASAWKKQRRLTLKVSWLILPAGIILMMALAVATDNVMIAVLPFMVALAVTVFVSVVHWRCPACYRNVGRELNPKFCPKCGVPLKEGYERPAELARTGEPAMIPQEEVENDELRRLREENERLRERLEQQASSAASGQPASCPACGTAISPQDARCPACQIALR